jgi:putative peptidoglycan lipid II flippase
LNVVFSILFSEIFRMVGWMPHGGLALANSLATALEMLGLFILMRRKLVGVEGRRLLKGLGQAGLGSILMGLVVWWWLSRFGSRPAWLVAGGGIILGGLAYGLALIGLRVPEVGSVLRGGLFKKGELPE